MAKRPPRKQEASPLVTVYRKADGTAVRVPPTVAEAIKNPPEDRKSKTFTTTQPKKADDKEKS